ncbi:MAG: PEGA domain-containing protein, partial [Polyangiaceae bacterium]|nr:PEGA domain-containing protein [Polyangiaceae bacterium]
AAALDDTRPSVPAAAALDDTRPSVPAAAAADDARPSVPAAAVASETTPESSADTPMADAKSEPSTNVEGDGSELARPPEPAIAAEVITAAPPTDAMAGTGMGPAGTVTLATGHPVVADGRAEAVETEQAHDAPRSNGTPEIEVGSLHPLTAVLAATLDRLTAEGSLSPPGGPPCSAELLAAVTDAPPVAVAGSVAPTRASLPAGTDAPVQVSTLPQAASVVPPRSLARRVQPILLLLAVVAGVWLLWLAMKPSDPPRIAEEERAIGAGPPRTTAADVAGAEKPERPSAPQPFPTEVTVSTPSSAASSVASAETAPVTHIVINSKPQGARLYENGKRIGTTPYAIDLPKGKVRRFAVFMDGYATRSVVVNGGHKKVLVGLVREEPAKPTGTTREGAADSKSIRAGTLEDWHP